MWDIQQKGGTMLATPSNSGAAETIHSTATDKAATRRKQPDQTD